MSVDGDEGAILCYFDVVASCATREGFREHLRPAFDRLVAKGLIEPVYILTDAGRAAVDEFEKSKLSKLGADT